MKTYIYYKFQILQCQNYKFENEDNTINSVKLAIHQQKEYMLAKPYELEGLNITVQLVRIHLIEFFLLLKSLVRLT